MAGSKCLPSANNYMDSSNLHSVTTAFYYNLNISVQGHSKYWTGEVYGMVWKYMVLLHLPCTNSHMIQTINPLIRSPLL